MPQRFVEVIDLQGEASGVLSTLIEKAGSVGSNIKVDLSDYINITTGLVDEKLVAILESYNLSSTDILETLHLFDLGISNTTLGRHIDRPRPIPLYLMIIGIALLASHLIIVHVSAKKLVNEFGNHV